MNSLYHFIRKIIEVIRILYRYILSCHLKIKPNKIVFMTYQNQYTCNPKYITEYLITHGHNTNLDLVWIVDQETIQNPFNYGIPESVRLVKRDSYQSYLELMTAKIWIDNALNCLWRIIPKRKEQFYFNTWHGALGIKRLDTYSPGKSYWRYIAHKSNHHINFMFSNSLFEDTVFKTSYWPNVNIIHTGHARNDLFFDKLRMVQARRKVLNYYNLDEGIQLLLYAPTFREDRNMSCFDLDYEKLLNTLCEKFPGSWKILLRFHYHNQKMLNPLYNHTDYIVHATDYPDIQELLAAADIGITDYSSWIYDFLLTQKPGFIYASDIESYMNQRGFYYPLESTPFSIAHNTEELCLYIKQFSYENYIKRVKQFLFDKGCMEDGLACKRIESIIMKCMKEGKYES